MTFYFSYYRTGEGLDLIGQILPHYRQKMTFSVENGVNPCIVALQCPQLRGMTVSHHIPMLGTIINIWSYCAIKA